jgi:hypothetical protein
MPQRSVLAALAIRDGRARARQVAARARGMPNPEVGCGVNTSRMIAGQHRLAHAPELHGAGRRGEPRLAPREASPSATTCRSSRASRTREQVQGIVWRELDKVSVRGRVKAEAHLRAARLEGAVGYYELEQLLAWHTARRISASAAGCRARRFETLTIQVSTGDCARSTGYVREFDNAARRRLGRALTLYEK